MKSRWRPEPPAPHRSSCLVRGIHLPGAGWIGLDPTSGLLTGEGHIPLVCTSRRALPPVEGLVERPRWKFVHDVGGG